MSVNTDSTSSNVETEVHSLNLIQEYQTYNEGKVTLNGKKVSWMSRLRLAYRNPQFGGHDKICELRASYEADKSKPGMTQEAVKLAKEAATQCQNQLRRDLARCAEELDADGNEAQKDDKGKRIGNPVKTATCVKNAATGQFEILHKTWEPKTQKSPAELFNIALADCLGIMLRCDEVGQLTAQRERFVGAFDSAIAELKAHQEDMKDNMPRTGTHG